MEYLPTLCSTASVKITAPGDAVLCHHPSKSPVDRSITELLDSEGNSVDRAYGVSRML